MFHAEGTVSTRRGADEDEDENADPSMVSATQVAPV
jgi:hypothetical protein